MVGFQGLFIAPHLGKNVPLVVIVIAGFWLWQCLKSLFIFFGLVVGSRLPFRIGKHFGRLSWGFVVELFCSQLVFIVPQLLPLNSCSWLGKSYDEKKRKEQDTFSKKKQGKRKQQGDEPVAFVLIKSTALFTGIGSCHTMGSLQRGNQGGKIAVIAAESAVTATCEFCQLF